MRSNAGLLMCLSALRKYGGQMMYRLSIEK